MTLTYEAWRITYQSSEQAARAAFERMMELEQGKCLHQIAEPAAIHPDDAAVDTLAEAMKAKLAKQRGKGYSGWDTDCTQEHLSNLLRSHVNKGDPVDVANFCAFLAARGEMICLTDAELINAMETRRAAEPQRLMAVTQPAPQAVQPAIMPKGESAAAQLRAMATNYPAGHSWDKLDARACIRGALEIEALRALLAAAPAHPAEGVPAPFSASGIAPCPLCGSASKHVKLGEDRGHRILCWNDDCECSSGYFSSKEDAIASWNSRAALAATQPAAQGLEALHKQMLSALESVGSHTVTDCDGDDVEVYFCNWEQISAAKSAALAAQAKQGGAND